MISLTPLRMKELIKKIYFLNLYLGIFTVIIFFDLQSSSSSNEPLIPVLIKKWTKTEAFEHQSELVWNLENAKDSIIYDANDPQANYIIPEDNCTISYKNNRWYVNGKEVKITALKIKIKGNGQIIHAKNQYKHFLFFLIREDYVFFIHLLPMEEYVFEVLTRETFVVWPFESHQLFSIAVRTYALNKIIEANAKKRPYALRNDIHNQTCIPEKHPAAFDQFKKAIKSTRGTVLVCNGKPILSMYHACCGGIIPGKCRGFDFEKHPYLKRMSSCTYCKDCKRSEWGRDEEVENIMKKLVENKTINEAGTDISIGRIKRSKSGAVQSVEFIITPLHYGSAKKRKKRYGKKTITLTHKECKKLFALNPHQQSFFIESIKKENNRIFIEGKGQGHHMGLCQQGARKMVEAGKGIREILGFYYPRSILIKWY